MAHLFVLKKRSNRLFCNNIFIAKINSLSLFNTFLQWTALFCYIFLRKLIFSFSIIYCSSIVNYFTITFLSPVPASRVIIAEETPDPPFWSKIHRHKKLSPELLLRYLISQQKIKSGELISENLGRMIMTPHSTARLNFSFNPEDYPAKSLFMRFFIFRPRNWFSF